MEVKADLIIVAGIFGLGFTLGTWLFFLGAAPRMVELTHAINAMNERMDKQREAMNRQVDTVNLWLKAEHPNSIEKTNQKGE